MSMAELTRFLHEAREQVEREKRALDVTPTTAETPAPAT
jgi:hypothetical protein